MWSAADNVRNRARGAAALWVVTLMATAGCDGHDEIQNAAGTLEATELDLATLVDGRVLDVRVREGDTVARGDTLLVVDTELLSLRRDQAAAGAKSLDAQKSEALERRHQAQRELELTETTLRRTRELVSQGSATAQQLDELEAKRDVATSQVAGARARVAVLEAQEIELARTIALFDRQIRDGVLIAPKGGTVLTRSLEPGEVARTGVPGLRMADLTQLELRVYLEATDLDLVRLGQPVQVRVDALGDEAVEGVISWIASEAEFTPKNAQTRGARAQLVYAVKVRIENANGRLHIGQPAEVVLEP